MLDPFCAVSDTANGIDMVNELMTCGLRLTHQGPFHVNGEHGDSPQSLPGAAGTLTAADSLRMK
jgi:hypothetical protein